MVPSKAMKTKASYRLFRRHMCAMQSVSTVLFTQSIVYINVKFFAFNFFWGEGLGDITKNHLVEISLYFVCDEFVLYLHSYFVQMCVFVCVRRFWSSILTAGGKAVFMITALEMTGWATSPPTWWKSSRGQVTTHITAVCLCMGGLMCGFCMCELSSCYVVTVSSCS